MQRAVKWILGFVCSISILFGAFVVLHGSLPPASINAWLPAGNLTAARANAAAVLLQDGRLLITGGNDASGPLASTDILDASGNFSPGPVMNFARAGHVAVALQDGRVLVAGGTGADGRPASSAEIFDPAANAWSATGPLMAPRSGATATLLADGRVLVAGGLSSGGPVNTLEIYDPNAGTFSLASGVLSSARENHAAVLLPTGQVLIAGGWDGTTLTPVDPATTGNPNVLASTDIFDPATGAVAPGPVMTSPRMNFTATTALDGSVVVIGGSNGQNDLASIELLSPGAGAFVLSGAQLTTARQGHLAFLLPHNGNILVIGGTSSGAAMSSAELYTPWLAATSVTGSMASARSSAAGSPLFQTILGAPVGIDGALVVAGGLDASSPPNTLQSAEVYGFATITTDQSDYPPGSPVTITGSGWQPGETVQMSLVEVPDLDGDSPISLTAVADANGNILNNSFSTNIDDANISFTLTAIGSASQAQTTFTDASAPNVTCSPNPIGVGNASACTASVPGGVTNSTINWTYSGGTGSFDSTSCSLSAANPATCMVHFTPSTAGSFTITATNQNDNKSGYTTLNTPPDLTATKTDDVSGSVTLPGTNSWTWSIKVQNTGYGGATFSHGNTVLTDNLPTSGLTYGAASVGSLSGVSTTAAAGLSCSIASNTLSCTVSGASGTLTVAGGGTFTVSFTATDTSKTPGSFANPTSSGICKVDPNGVIANDPNTANNSCSDTVDAIEPYKVTFAASPTLTGVTSGTTVVSYSGTQNGSAVSGTVTAGQLGTAAATITFDGGTSVTYTYSSPLSAGTGKRFVLDASKATNPDPASPISSLSADTTVTGYYVAQSEVTFTASGLPIGGSSDTTGTVVSFSGTQAGEAVGPVTKAAADLSFSDYFDNTTSVSATYTTPINSTTAGKGYVLSSITGGTGTLPTHSLTVSAPVTITGNYDVYMLAWDTSSVFTAQYSDVTGLVAKLTETPSGGITGGVSGKSVTFCVYSGTCGAGSDTGSASTNASGVATDTTDLSQAAGTTYTSSASSTPATGLTLTITHAYTITTENAAIAYTGDLVTTVGGTLNLRATVWDSAAIGYPGINPESGAGATIGNITKMYIQFNVYSALGCGTAGGLVSSSIAQVANSPGSGIGTASTTLTSATENSYCVIATLVNSSGGTNLYYTAPDAQAVGITFYTNNGQFATGGGWIVDPTGSHGNFGFNGRYNKKGQPTGQMVYVWRGLSNNVMADFIIKSTSQNLTALGFSNSTGTFPVSALMQGGCVLQIIRESDGALIGGQGNLYFAMQATDSGANSGIGSDSFALTVLDSSHNVIHIVGNTLLSGGNVVVHVK